MHYRHIINTAAFILLCMAPHHGYAENWVWLTSTDKASYYVDTDSIQHNDRQDDEKADYTTKMVVLNGDTYYAHEEIDITYKTHKNIDFTIVMPDGTTKGPISYETGPTDIKYGTIDYVMYRKVFVPIWLSSPETDSDHSNIMLFTEQGKGFDTTYLMDTSHTAFAYGKGSHQADQSKVFVPIIKFLDPATRYFFNGSQDINSGYDTYEFDLTHHQYRLVVSAGIMNNGNVAYKVNHLTNPEAVPFSSITDPNIQRFFDFTENYVAKHSDQIARNGEIYE